MIFKAKPLKDVYLLELDKYTDERGFFARTWCREEFEEHGLELEMVQANVSHNPRAGTLRGMHYQRAPHGEDKLVRCTRGSIYDVVVDMRAGSPTYKEWVGVELTEDNYRQLFVPRGCAHGFITLADDTEVTYQVSEFYTPGHEEGLRYDDPAIGIQWPRDVAVISEKDQSWPHLSAANETAVQE